MKKSIMFLAMMMTSTLIFAQRHHGDSNKTGDRRSDRFKKELSLSDEQAAKVKAIRAKFGERQMKIRKDTALTQGTARNEQRKLRTEQEAELKGVLSSEQWKKYTEMKARFSEHRKKFHRGSTERG